MVYAVVLDDKSFNGAIVFEVMVEKRDVRKVGSAALANRNVVEEGRSVPRGMRSLMPVLLLSAASLCILYFASPTAENGSSYDATSGETFSFENSGSNIVWNNASDLDLFGAQSCDVVSPDKLEAWDTCDGKEAHDVENELLRRRAASSGLCLSRSLVLAKGPGSKNAWVAVQIKPERAGAH